VPKRSMAHGFYLGSRKRNTLPLSTAWLTADSQ
jgi:hypothetical protein